MTKKTVTGPMKVVNSYNAKATTDLRFNDPVVIVNDECRPAIFSDKIIYHVMDKFVSAGQMAELAGKDTKFIIELSSMEGRRRNQGRIML